MKSIKNLKCIQHYELEPDRYGIFGTDTDTDFFGVKNSPIQKYLPI